VPGLVADGQAVAPQPLVDVPAGPPSWQGVQEHVRLASLGPEATMQTALTFGGGVAERLRKGLRNATPAERWARALALYQRLYRGGTLAGEPRLEGALQADRLTVGAELRLPRFAQPHAGGWCARPTRWRRCRESAAAAPGRLGAGLRARRCTLSRARRRASPWPSRS